MNTSTGARTQHGTVMEPRMKGLSFLSIFGKKKKKKKEKRKEEREHQDALDKVDEEYYDSSVDKSLRIDKHLNESILNKVGAGAIIGAGAGVTFIILKNIIINMRKRRKKGQRDDEDGNDSDDDSGDTVYIHDRDKPSSKQRITSNTRGGDGGGIVGKGYNYAVGSGKIDTGRPQISSLQDDLRASHSDLYAVGDNRCEMLFRKLGIMYIDRAPDILDIVNQLKNYAHCDRKLFNKIVILLDKMIGLLSMVMHTQHSINTVSRERNQTFEEDNKTMSFRSFNVMSTYCAKLLTLVNHFHNIAKLWLTHSFSNDKNRHKLSQLHRNRRDNATSSIGTDERIFFNRTMSNRNDALSLIHLKRTKDDLLRIIEFYPKQCITHIMEMCMHSDDIDSAAAATMASMSRGINNTSIYSSRQQQQQQQQQQQYQDRKNPPTRQQYPSRTKKQNRDIRTAFYSPPNIPLHHRKYAPDVGSNPIHPPPPSHPPASKSTFVKTHTHPRHNTPMKINNPTHVRVSNRAKTSKR